MQNNSPPATKTPSNHRTSGTGALTNKLFLILAICVVSMNLRPVLISLGPVVDSVRADLGVSGSTIGLLITLPILCFGAFAPFAPRLLRLLSAERLILISLLVLALGIGVRSLFGVAGLFIGTLISGAAISVVMVLLPGIIKHHFHKQAGMMMGLYSSALCLGAAITAATTVPIENIPGSNWRWALAFWLIPALIAAAIWWPQSTSGRQIIQTRKPGPKLRSNKLAWQVTLFMGFQSAIAYCLFGWMPLILIDRGLTPVTAGLILSLAMIVQLSTSLTAPWIATRGRDQRSTIAVLLILVLIGIVGLIYGSLDVIWLWATILGLGLGGTFSLALALLVLRAPNAQVAVALSGMAQGVGYTVAAAGPYIVGLLHEYMNNWHGAAAFFVFLVLASLFFGMGAGRARYIQVD